MSAIYIERNSCTFWEILLLALELDEKIHTTLMSVNMALPQVADLTCVSRVEVEFIFEYLFKSLYMFLTIYAILC